MKLIKVFLLVCKTYGFITKNYKDNLVVKAKGVKPESVTWNSFESLLEDNITTLLKE